MSKQILFKLQNNGGSYQIIVSGDKKKQNWEKINGDIIYDYQLNAIIKDAKTDGYKTKIQK